MWCDSVFLWALFVTIAFHLFTIGVSPSTSALTISPTSTTTTITTSSATTSSAIPRPTDPMVPLTDQVVVTLTDLTNMNVITT